jgi:hypothetical protein
VFGTVLSKAVIGTPTDDPVAAAIPVTPTPESPAPRTSAVRRIPRTELEHAAELAPFDPEREAPGGRYQLPGERVEVVVAPPPREEERREPPPAPEFQVLGTATGSDGALAVIRLENGTPRFLSVGQEMEGYRLTAVDRGRVTMSNAERTVQLSIASASPTGPATRGRQGQAQARQGQGNITGRVGGAAQGGRAGGAAPARATPAQTQAQAVQAELMIQQLQQRMQAAGAQGQIQVQTDGNRVIVTTPNGQRVIQGAERRDFQVDVARPR